LLRVLTKFSTFVQIKSSVSKKCPYCFGKVQERAKKCRYCGEWLSKRKSLSPVYKKLFALLFVILLVSSVLYGIFLFSDNSNDSQSDLVCARKVPYTMEPEFTRALSLLAQRASQDLTSQHELNVFTSMYNCLEIKYARNDSEMMGAEGYFRFVPGQSIQKLEILVSPRYRKQDDIVTALLLSHEYAHALGYYADLKNGVKTDCFEDEAFAFAFQFRFLSLLNPEESKSVLSRLLNDPSPELNGVAHTMEAIITSPGNSFEQKALNYVKSKPAYQKQCTGR
jgi:hypothetical protein